MPQSRSTALQRQPKRESWGSNKDKTNVTYETTENKEGLKQIKLVHNLLSSYSGIALDIDDGMNAMIADAMSSVVFGKLEENGWNLSGIRIDTKFKVWKAVILSTFLYACKSWTVFQRHAEGLTHFHSFCLRKLPRTEWRFWIPNTDDLKKAEMTSIYNVLNSSLVKEYRRRHGVATITGHSPPMTPRERDNKPWQPVHKP